MAKKMRASGTEKILPLKAVGGTPVSAELFSESSSTLEKLVQ